LVLFSSFPCAAEVIGSAIALKLLLDIPLLVGVCITVLDVLVVLSIFERPNRFRVLEASLRGSLGWRMGFTGCSWVSMEITGLRRC
jgi:Mn2+/Fe2+ NRAMP family transporter